MHVGIGHLTKCPDIWTLNDDEAASVSNAAVAAFKHISPTGMSQKAIDFAALAVAVGSVYIPRVIMTADDMSKRKAGAEPDATPAGGAEDPMRSIQIITGSPDNPVRLN